MPESRGQSAFRSETIDRLGASREWRLPGGALVLPRVFGFCRGVTRALEMLERAVADPQAAGRRFFLLGPIIHNPWVNRTFEQRGVRILSRPQMQDLSGLLTAEDCAVVPTFGAPPPIGEQLRRIGCRVIDTTCPDVRRLWAWACKAARGGCGVLIYGRADHDETVVTRSHLEAVGGSYAVVGDLDAAESFCRMIVQANDSVSPREAFGEGASNADSLAPFLRLAQVSQTTMLYEETEQVRAMLLAAFEKRFGPGAGERLLLQPTVCRATQDRQSAARELCQAGCDLIVVVGGFGSSNTRHLYELAARRGPAFFIEDASAILGPEAIRSFDASAQPAPTDSARAGGQMKEVRHWLPARRPLRIGVLAGASSPEAVVGVVLRKLAELLSA